MSLVSVGIGRVVVAVGAAMMIALASASGAAAQEPGLMIDCPCTIWEGAAPTSSGPDSDSSPVELGVRFRSDVGGYITGVRFYKYSANSGQHIGNLWATNGTKLATAIFISETASGWQQVTFPVPVPITAGTTYIASYHTNTGRYAASNGYFNAGFDNAPLHALQDGVSGPSGVYVYGTTSSFPNYTYNAANYWVDVVFDTQVSPLRVAFVTPAADATGVSLTSRLTAGFYGGVSYPSVNTTTYVLRDPAGNLVPATVGSGGETETFPLIPTVPLAYGTTYTATIKGGPDGVKGYTGATMTEDYVWSFTTVPAPPPPAECPCTVWNGATTAPSGPDPDTGEVELGFRFRADVPGYITALRFYKHATNTGPHVGTLWTNSGVTLARALFTNETASGWQQVTLPTPIPIQANATYVASYHTTVGHYAANSGYLATPVDNPPLHALADGVDGPSGVYRYGSGSAIPNQSYFSANYWVDVVFATTLPPQPPDVTPPTVASVQPWSGTPAATDTYVTATFSEMMDPATINSSTVMLQNNLGVVVAANISYSVVNGTAIIVPTSPLAHSTSYMATIKGANSPEPRAKDLAGNALSSTVSWTFTTVGPLPPCPCSIWGGSSITPVADSDTSAVELGVRFRSEVSGYITGLRYYKPSANIGTHVGSLWSNTGALLARATFVNESASGWQQVNFPPVAIAANTTYVASYHSPLGRYAASNNYFTATYDNRPLHALLDGLNGRNGVYAYGASRFPTDTYAASNYWVDVVFNTTPVGSDTTPPALHSSWPAAGATGVSVNSVITATFTEMMAFSSVNTSTFELLDPDGELVPATVMAGGETPTQSLTPSSPLAPNTMYGVIIRGGATGMKDTAGNPLAATYGWSFTTGGPP